METNDHDSERIIRYSGYKLLWLFWPVPVLVVISVLVNPQEWRDPPLWVVLVFGGSVVFLAVGCLVFPRTFSLRLTADGLLVHRVGNEQFYRWCEVSDFRIVDGPSHTGIRIVWNLTDDSPHRTALIATTSSILGHDVSLLDTFEVSADELVDLLNAWQQRYGTNPSETDLLGRDNEMNRAD